MSTTTPKPRSAAQIAASQANGAKSKGPTTPEGKTKVSKNRMTHGFRADCVALATEDSDAYDAHLASYLARYTPTDKVEEDLVGLLASSMWQIMRNNSIETSLFEIEIGEVANKIEGQFRFMDNYGILEMAFKKSAGDNALELLRRYKSTSERAYHRAFAALEELRKSRPQPQPADPANLSTVQTQDQHEHQPSDQPMEQANPLDQIENPRVTVIPDRQTTAIETVQAKENFASDAPLRTSLSNN